MTLYSIVIAIILQPATRLMNEGRRRDPEAIIIETLTSNDIKTTIHSHHLRCIAHCSTEKFIGVL